MPGVPGKGGPVPKRSDQRRRRNKDRPLTSAASGGVRGEPLEGEHSEHAQRFWESLRRSGQSQFYEPSDWAAAELVVVAIDTFVRKPSAMLLASIQSAMSNLLVTEGDRRRARLELQRVTEEPEEADVSELAEYRRRASS